jgi:polysaccharide biosynthesis protein PslG
VRTLLLATLLALAAAAPAQAAQATENANRPWPIPVVGIGEQNPVMFSSPYFTALKIKHVRVVTAWDSLRHRWSRGELDAYMYAARAAGVQVLLGFGHARSKKRKVRRYVPGVREFTKEFLKYKKRYPWQKEWLTWNEANHCGEPTCHKARRVARFYNNIRHNCYGCTVVAADVLDTPTMPAWVREFRRTARNDKVIWGLHNYIDANRFRTKGTKALLKAAPRGNIWFTETGGLVVRRNGSRIAFPGNRKHAAKATKQVFRLARLSKRIRRVYIYHWIPQRVKLPTWDSALMDPRGKPRPAYKVLKSFVQRFAREARLRKERAREEASPVPTPTPAPTSGGAPAPTATPSPTPAP